MAENTKIQWATHTFNPWRGCTKIAAGCANCYADAQSKRNSKTLGIWGPNGTRVVASEAMWREPLKWNRDVETTAEVWTDDRPRVFCASLADVFEDWPGPVLDSQGRRLHVAPSGKWCPEGLGSPIYDDGWSALSLASVRARLFRLIDATPNLDWLLLTKRPENVRRMLPVKAGRKDVIVNGKTNVEAWRRENVWLGTSIACQEDADRNVPELLKCRDLCAKTFLSLEPLIGPVDLSRWLAKPKCSMCGHPYANPENRDRTCAISGGLCAKHGVDWVIVGGESGQNARPCNIEWIRSIVRQCRDAVVPVFVKQLGSSPIGLRFEMDEQGRPYCVERNNFRGRANPLDPKGGDPAEWPEDVRVREVPQ